MWDLFNKNFEDEYENYFVFGECCDKAFSYFYRLGTNAFYEFSYDSQEVKKIASNLPDVFNWISKSQQCARYFLPRIDRVDISFKPLNLPVIEFDSLRKGVKRKISL